jgi:hypothetical protein
MCAQLLHRSLRSFVRSFVRSIDRVIGRSGRQQRAAACVSSCRARSPPSRFPHSRDSRCGVSPLNAIFLTTRRICHRCSTRCTVSRRLSKYAFVSSSSSCILSDRGFPDRTRCSVEEQGYSVSRRFCDRTSFVANLMYAFCDPARVAARASSCSRPITTTRPRRRSRSLSTRTLSSSILIC